MLDRVSTIVLGLDGLGRRGTLCRLLTVGHMATRSAEGDSQRFHRGEAFASSRKKQISTAKKKLSYAEVRELETIEERIAEADRKLEAMHVALEDSAVTSDPALLASTCVAMEEAQGIWMALYARWGELEKRRVDCRRRRL